MSVTTGLQVIGSYTAGDSLATLLGELLRIIPNPDAPHGTGAVAGGGFLDEMSPGAAAGLRAEIAYLLAAANGTGIDDIAYGEHTITAGEASANLVDIVTGLSDLTLSRCAISVWNGTTLATSDAVITEPTAGTIRVADGSTYNTVAGYVIRWIARKVSA